MAIQRPKHRITRYGELVSYVRARIYDQTFAPGMRLPTEMALAHEHHISRSTVRQALDLLEQEGLVERIQGSGTFVRQRPTQGHADLDRSRQDDDPRLFGRDQAAVEAVPAAQQKAGRRVTRAET